MTREEFIRALDEKGISYSLEGERIVVNWDNQYINLEYLGITSLPPDVTFENAGSLRLGEVAQLPEGTVFNNYGSVVGEEITRIPRGTKFGKGVRTVLLAGGTINFDIEGFNYGDLLTATFKYL
jgi:hypothetical protein